MKIAITGANGFLGRALTSAAKNQGIDVAVHFGPPPTNNAATSNLHEEVVDICDADLLVPLFVGADSIIHLAGPSDVAGSFRDPAETTRAHVAGTAAVLDAAQRSQVRQLIYISSAEVYGRTDHIPTKETAALLPLSPYGAAKAAAELLVAAALRRGGLDRAVVLRPFSVYGPGGRRTSVLGRMLGQIRRREPLCVFSTRPVRDYVHVADVVAAILRALPYDASGLLTANIASGKGISVGELGTALATLAGSPVGIVEISDADRPLSHDINHLVGDASVAESALGWRPAVDLATGLRQCLDATEVAS